LYIGEKIITISLIQYIYSEINLNPTTMKKLLLNCAGLTLIGLLFTPSSTNAQMQINVDANAAWVGYANFFNLDEENTYAGGSVWGVADIKTVISTGNNTLTLQPNFNAYNPNDEFWSNGAIGNKLFEGNTYVEDNTLLTEDIEFIGHTDSNTLAEGYTAVAFVKVLSADYQLLQYLPVDLEAGSDFSISLDVATIEGAAHVQYGFSVTGLNANPTQEAALGSATVTAQEVVGVTKFSSDTTTVYPNPVNDVLYVTSQNTIEQAAIYNMLGQKVMSSSINNQSGSINVSSLNSGLYIITTTSQDKQTSTRFIKK
jgi:hypothetical protein